MYGTGKGQVRDMEAQEERPLYRTTRRLTTVAHLHGAVQALQD